MDSPATRPTPMVKIAGLTLTGGAAIVGQFVILGLIVAIVWYAHPTSHNWHLWVSAVMWIGFQIYWSVAAKKAAPTKSSESRASRAVHERLMTFALLMLFVPVPGLGIRFLPRALIV